MTNEIHVLNWTLKTCFSGHCKIEFIGSFMQFANTKVIKTLG
jgi:hypothetical protein